MMFRVHWYSFWIAMTVGCLVNIFGDWLFGIRIELFWGLETFNFLWFLQLFIWPVVVGISVSYVYGLGGKWIAILPADWRQNRRTGISSIHRMPGVPDGNGAI